MSYITYRQLIESAKKFTEEQLDQPITILDLDCDEYFPCNGTSFARDDGVLDEDHIVLVINAEIGAYGK